MELESIIGNIYQSFAGQDMYKSIEEKTSIGISDKNSGGKNQKFII